MGDGYDKARGFAGQSLYASLGDEFSAVRFRRFCKRPSVVSAAALRITTVNLQWTPPTTAEVRG
jgi:hypothetical protein